MEKLVDVFNTKYFASHWRPEVEAYIASHREVDLAGAKISADVMNAITIYQDKGTRFIDSEDPNRDRILRENLRRSFLNYEPVKLSEPKNVDDIGDYINKLSPDLTYTIPAIRPELYIPLAVLIQVFRPKIKLDLDTQYDKFMTYVYTKIFPNAYHWKKFYILTGSTFDVIEEQEDGTYRIPFEGDLSYDDFIGNHVVIPYDFGNTWLEDKEEWSLFIDSVITDLETQIAPKGNKLKEYL